MRFYTIKQEDSGPGLALSRQIMIAHDGAIAMVNNDGGGARCTLIFFIKPL